MKEIIIYHGSECIVKVIDYRYSNPHNDYGVGFYCTKDLDLAKQWAVKSNKEGYVNKYAFDISGLKVLDLTDKNKYSVLNWIAILLKYRNLSSGEKERYKSRLEYLSQYYIDISDYDVVIGYRSDDAYFKFPKMFLDDQISLSYLEEIYMLGNLGTQFVLISNIALTRIRYISSEIVDASYYNKYLNNIDKANLMLEKIVISSSNELGTKLLDLLREYDKNK